MRSDATLLLSLQIWMASWPLEGYGLPQRCVALPLGATPNHSEQRCSLWFGGQADWGLGLQRCRSSSHNQQSGRTAASAFCPLTRTRQVSPISPAHSSKRPPYPLLDPPQRTPPRHLSLAHYAIRQSPATLTGSPPQSPNHALPKHFLKHSQQAPVHANTPSPTSRYDQQRAPDDPSCTPQTPPPSPPDSPPRSIHAPLLHPLLPNSSSL